MVSSILVERVDNAYVYKWTDWSNGMYYVGVHNGKDKNYLGSGVRFKSAYNKRPWAFTREILFIGDYEKCISFEENILTSVNAAQNEIYYNLSNTASGCSGRVMSDEEKLKRSNALKGRVFSCEHINNLSLAHKKRNRSTYNGGNFSKKVYCELLNEEFDSIRDLSIKLRKSQSYISNMLKGRKKNIYGIKYLS